MLGRFGGGQEREESLSFLIFLNYVLCHVLFECCLVRKNTKNS